MRVLVTGAGGFIGRALTEALLDAGQLTNASGGKAPITELFLADRVAIATPSHPRVALHAMQGDLVDPAFVDELAAQGHDSIFHLAASLTLDVERDPTAAYAESVGALMRLLEGAARRPRLMFASSIAVFGGPLPDAVDDSVRATPTTTYGALKAISELLLADASRRGRVDARSLRLPIVVVRPGAATPALSDRVAAIIREPLAGRDMVCPFDPATRIPIASARAVARAFIALHDVDPRDLPIGRAMNLPSLTVSVAEMVAAVEARKPGHVRYAVEPALQAIVDGWPRRFVSDVASRIGLRSDPSLEDIIDEYLDAAG
jgi:D-erythronate 2-dehydrogenase